MVFRLCAEGEALSVHFEFREVNHEEDLGRR